MTTLAVELEIPDAVDISITEDAINVELIDGRSISALLEGYPRLVHAAVCSLESPLGRVRLRSRNG